MRLHFGIAFNLALIACLSSIMLGSGSSTYFSTVLVFIAAGLSLYFTDMKGVIQLNRFTSNFFILLIVFLSLGELFRYRTVDLAIGIARLLQLVQIVVLFQEKNSRNRWHILLISFLQVVVATAFQLSMSFGLLLFVYVFANLCALTLMFLHEENAYFKKHSYVKNPRRFDWTELRERQSRTRILKLAFTTVVLGPLSLILLNRDSESERTKKSNFRTGPIRPRDAKFQDAQEKEAAGKKKKSDRWSFRSFFAELTAGFTPKTPAGEEEEEERAVEKAPSISRKNTWSTKIHWEPAIENTSSGIWENEAEIETGESSEFATSFNPIHFLHSNPASQEHTETKWPLLHISPIFSGGTNRQTGLVGGQRELYGRLIHGTLWSLLFGIVIFLIIPRGNGTDLFGQHFSYQRWRAANPQMVTSVGFTDKIQLGSLGSVLQNYGEVLTVEFTTTNLSKSDLQGVRRADFFEVPEQNYRSLIGNDFYLRGVVVDQYESNQWSRSSPGSDPIGHLISGEAALESVVRILPGDDVSKVFFDEKNDLVKLNTITQRLDSAVLFTVWPFYIPDSRSNHVSGYPDRITVPQNRRFPRDGFRQSFYTSVFRSGVQQELCPLQESLSLFTMLQIQEKDLPTLVDLARKWDRESDLEESEYIARAKNLEQRLKNDPRFSYQLGGIIRDSGKDPLEDFVAKNPRGHCEYFAGTLAMMLRCVGIPSRICIGYKVSAEKSNHGKFMVRQSNAHSWVEAFIPPSGIPSPLIQGSCSHHWTRGGLLRLDATPEVDGTIMEGFSMSLSDINRFVQRIWREYVLNMDGSRQSTLVYDPIRQAWGSLREKVAQEGLWMHIFQRYKQLFLQIRAGTLEFSDYFLIAAPFLLGFGIVYVVFRSGIAGLLRTLFVRMGEKKRDKHSTVEFYVHLERILSRFGIRRFPAETPQEFVHRSVPLLLQRISEAKSRQEQEISGAFSKDFLDESSERIVDSFYRIRFGNQRLTESEMRRIEEDLHHLERLRVLSSR